MTGRECYHCKQWIAEGQAHDCWTTTEAALTRGLSEDLREAWERIRETATEFGDQRIYASHSSIMFARRACYFFVRPKKTFLEMGVFLGRPVTSPLVRRVGAASRTKFYLTIRITHRDQVEAPISDWLREAYEFVETRAKPASSAAAAPAKKGPRKRTGKAKTVTVVSKAKQSPRTKRKKTKAPRR
jgi:hypothetical protein